MTQQHARDLAAVLGQHFEAEVESEEVGPGRYRFAVVTPRFVDMPHLQRQDEIWEVIKVNISRDLKLDISLVLAFAPNELELAP